MRRMREDMAFLKTCSRRDAERRRARTQRLVEKMVDSTAKSTPECRIEAGKARAAAVFTQVEDIAAQADLNAPQAQAVLDLAAVRIDDLGSLFASREQLPGWLRERIKRIYAKINWQTRAGRKGYFNVAVHKNHIPIDKALTILAHLKGELDGDDGEFTQWADRVIECGLFSSVRRGKFQYQNRCQDSEYCELCNYLNISDGLKMLYEAYSSTAFNRGGDWFALTVAPRTSPTDARAAGRTLTPEDWYYENEGSVVYKEARCKRAFVYDPAYADEETADWQVEARIRQFLGAVQFVFGKLVKNGWLDGIRARVENSVEFLPYASHQHWHSVGSSTCEHDPQKMAEFIKEEVDAILARTCPGVYADVVIAVVPSPQDLRRWVKYLNKTVNLVVAVESVYNRHPGLRRNDPVFGKLMGELQLFPERSRRVFGMIRVPIPGRSVRGAHTYMLRRRFVAGSHKFGKGSILTEPERHRLWRERHAEKEAERRGRKGSPPVKKAKRHVLNSNETCCYPA